MTKKEIIKQYGDINEYIADILINEDDDEEIDAGRLNDLIFEYCDTALMYYDDIIDTIKNYGDFSEVLNGETISGYAFRLLESQCWEGLTI